MISVNSIGSMKAKYALPVIGLLFPFFTQAQTQAQQTPAQETGTYMSNGVFLILVAVIFMLMLVIIGMTELVKAGASHQRKREKEKNASIKSSALLLLFLLGGVSLFAQADAPATTAAAAPPAIPFNYWGLGAIMFYSMTAIIVLELIIIYVLYRTGIGLLKVDLPEKKTVGESFMESKLMKSITGNQTPEQEAAILTDHDYDGIRELDNNLPGWWKYGFYLTIVIAVIYLFNYHILDTGLSSAEEYEKEMKEAEEQIAEYKRTNSNSVDENTVVLLTDATSISAGKAVYSQNCVACHGTMGEGKVGPNLTDDYWLHKGGIVDVFKSVKYGWTEKGMKSWEQDLKPIEIQQVSSYILSLRGTNPPDAKEKEGELDTQNGPAGGGAPVVDSVSPAPDSAQQK